MAMMMAASFFGAAGCSAENTVAQKVETEPGKVLIAYYSWSGNTRFAAEQIQKLTGGTLFEIKPAKAYPSDYSACVDQAKQECRDEFKPELATKVDDFQSTMSSSSARRTGGARWLRRFGASSPATTSAVKQ